MDRRAYFPAILAIETDLWTKGTSKNRRRRRRRELEGSGGGEAPAKGKHNTAPSSPCTQNDEQIADRRGREEVERVTGRGKEKERESAGERILSGDIQ